MPKISGFEELVAWQKARILCREVYRVSRSPRFARDRDLQRQIRRAAVSVVSNIAEGFERGRKSEFAQFLLIAKGSCGEVQAQLYVALDEGYISDEEFLTLKRATQEAGRIIAGLRRSVLEAPR